MLASLKHARTAALAVAAALLGGLLTLGTPPAADAAVPATIPLTITNNSGRGDQVHVYVLGTSLTTGQQGWADAGGTFHPWPAGGIPPVPAPDASIPGPAAGQSTTIRIPKLSGRIYFLGDPAPNDRFPWATCELGGGMAVASTGGPASTRPTSARSP
ncbi:hypothetical protein SGLAM104S_05855 [Streptomyces glaucescens]